MRPNFVVKRESRIVIATIIIIYDLIIILIQLHNLEWEIGFGQQLGMSPEQSLSLLMDPTKIPAEVMTSPTQQWNPDSIMAAFEGDNFLQMMDDINQCMEVPVQA